MQFECKICDWSPQASGEGSGYGETRPPKPAVEKHSWTVWSNQFIIKFFLLLRRFDNIHLLLFCFSSLFKLS